MIINSDATSCAIRESGFFARVGLCLDGSFFPRHLPLNASGRLPGGAGFRKEDDAEDSAVHGRNPTNQLISSATQKCPVSRLLAIDPCTSAAIATAVDPAPTTTATVYPPTAAATATTVYPSPAATAPAVDPTAGVGLGRRCKPAAPKDRRCNCRTGPLPHALKKKAPV